MTDATVPASAAETPAAIEAPRRPRFAPRAPVRVQLFLAAFVWAVGASILLVRGVIYVSDRSWHSWALAAVLATLIAVPKTRYILDGTAKKAVERIYRRGTACVFGFFSVRAWLFIVLMMGGGIIIRNTFVRPDAIGAGILGALYVGIGAALAAADRHFWRAAFSPVPDSSGRD